MAAKFGVFVDEDHSKLPTIYWLPKLHKRPNKSRFIANSSSLKTMSLNIAQHFVKGMVKIYFGLLKIQMKFLIN